MGNCQACMNDPQNLSEYGAHQNAKQTSFYSIVRRSQPFSKASLAEIVNTSQHQLRTSQKPSIHIQKKASLSMVGNGVDIQKQKTNSEQLISVHCPIAKLAQPWGRPASELQSLIGSKVKMVLSKLKEYQYIIELKLNSIFFYKIYYTKFSIVFQLQNIEIATIKNNQLILLNILIKQGLCYSFLFNKPQCYFYQSSKPFLHLFIYYCSSDLTTQKKRNNENYIYMFYEMRAIHAPSPKFKL
ncbi:unnamed protein product [Paramecium primaurelia]|uniref:Uncharacterized protein n=1 Tax=Paramecium primaurelia TaxID=5886 RepID=A0A8S1LZ79_PARPR|nr:unnamed protein product [Paramecium primaurelia]